MTPASLVEDRLLTITECASHLRVSRSRAYQLVKDGELPSVRIGERSVRVRPADLEAFVRDHVSRDGS